VIQGPFVGARPVKPWKRISCSYPKHYPGTLDVVRRPRSAQRHNHALKWRTGISGKKKRQAFLRLKLWDCHKSFCVVTNAKSIRSWCAWKQRFLWELCYNWVMSIFRLWLGSGRVPPCQWNVDIELNIAGGCVLHLLDRSKMLCNLCLQLLNRFRWFFSHLDDNRLKLRFQFIDKLAVLFNVIRLQLVQSNYKNAPFRRSNV
jgi:hypothetical protein